MASQVESIKWVPGTKFMVDGFAFTSARCQHYFLTHCHSDHTVGLTKSFSAGTIWCSPVSARLLAAEWGLRAPCVRELQLHQPVNIDGVTVTALDANHCPGSIMLLFEVPTGRGNQVKHILHTGDCRWHDGLRSGSCLASKQVDVLMLDTTYALPKHTFPPQQEAIDLMVQMMREALCEEPATLLVVSSYHIGKERAYLGAAAALGVKVYVPDAKRRVLELLGLTEQQLELLSNDPVAQLHVGCTSVVPQDLLEYLQEQQHEHPGRWNRILGVRATGWTYRRSGGLQVQHLGDSVTVVGVPYSEHSSWPELRQCVSSLRPKRLIPTVNAANERQQQALVDRFAALMDLSSNKSRIEAYLVKGPAARAASHRMRESQESQGQDQPDMSDAGAVGTPEASAATAGMDVGSTMNWLQDLTAQEGPGAFGDLQLGTIDIAEQHKLLEDAARLARLRRSVELRAKQRQRGRVTKKSAPSKCLNRSSDV